MNLKEFKVLNELYTKKQSYLREIAKNTSLPYGTVQKILERSKNQIDSREEGKNKYFSLKNTLENKYLILQIEIEKTKQFIKKNPKLKPFIEKLLIEKTPLLIFGSFAKNTQSNTSDIDILILSEKEPILPKHLTTYKLHSVSVPVSNLSELKKQPLFIEIKQNHIIITGYETYLKEVFNYE